MATAEVEALRVQVEATKGVMESAGVLLAGLHQRLTDVLTGSWLILSGCYRG